MAWKPPSLRTPELLHQQQVVAALLHPQSPVQRLLADHNTGSGKTLVMIHTLDNFYADPRPKVAIFPKYVVMDNFYLGLLDWPSRWRDYICMRHSSMACTAANFPNWRSVKEQHWQLHLHNQKIEARILEFGEALQKTLKELFMKPAHEILEMKHAFFNGRMRDSFVQQFWADVGKDSTIQLPAGPLRAYRFTSAGGSAAEKDVNSSYPTVVFLRLALMHSRGCYNPDPQVTPQVDVLFFTFPCQPFFSAGKRDGVHDSQGLLVENSLDYIRLHTPKAIIFENVDKIVTAKFKPLVEYIKQELTALKYVVLDQVSNVKDYHVPQNHSRWYMVALEAGSRSFNWQAKLVGGPFQHQTCLGPEAWPMLLLLLLIRV